MQESGWEKGQKAPPVDEDLQAVNNCCERKKQHGSRIMALIGDQIPWGQA